MTDNIYILNDLTDLDKSSDSNSSSDDSKQTSKQRYLKKYYIANKDKLRQKEICNECGYKYMKNNWTNHIHTQKHMNGIMVKQLRIELEVFRSKVSIPIMV
jgi:hypothetical protein